MMGGMRCLGCRDPYIGVLVRMTGSVLYSNVLVYSMERTFIFHSMIMICHKSV